MPVFNLTQDALSRLSAKFEEFQQEREMMEALLADYVVDYSVTTGNLDTYRLLASQLLPLPQFSHSLSAVLSHVTPPK